MDVPSLNLPPCCHISLPYIAGFDIKVIYQSIQTKHLHAYRIVIIIIILIIAVWILCFYVMPHATLIF